MKPHAVAGGELDVLPSAGDEDLDSPDEMEMEGSILAQLTGGREEPVADQGDGGDATMDATVQAPAAAAPTPEEAFGDVDSSAPATADGLAADAGADSTDWDAASEDVIRQLQASQQRSQEAAALKRKAAKLEEAAVDADRQARMAGRHLEGVKTDARHEADVA